MAFSFQITCKVVTCDSQNCEGTRSCKKPSLPLKPGAAIEVIRVLIVVKFMTTIEQNREIFQQTAPSSRLTELDRHFYLAKQYPP